MTALVLDDVSYVHPDGTPALSHVSLAFEQGERVAVLGPNGAGKTTLALHLNGTLEATGGRVLVGGVAVGRDTVRDVRRTVGIVFQDPDDQLFLPTVREDVAFGPANLGLAGDELDARVAEALAAVDLPHVADRPPHHLSFGQRRRAALATVLAMHPDVLVLDEPTANLDPMSRRELADVLQRLGAHHTIIVVTHDLPYALELCPRSVLLDSGEVVADGRTADLLADEALLAAHRLELPYAFDRTALLGSASTPLRAAPLRSSTRGAAGFER